jgi:hypothetical protein
MSVRKRRHGRINAEKAVGRTRSEYSDTGNDRFIDPAVPNKTTGNRNLWRKRTRLTTNIPGRPTERQSVRG